MTEARGGEVRVRYWAAARAAAGVSDEQVPGADLAAVLAGVHVRHPEPGFARLLAVCSLLVDGTPVGGREPSAVALAPGATVEVLPPFAGG